MKHQRFIETCIEALGIVAPIAFEFIDTHVIPLLDEFSQEEGAAEAWCIPYDDGTFTIQVSKYGGFSEEVLIAHELCHVAVWLSNPSAKPHGRIFQKTARFLEGVLAETGIVLEAPLYDPRTDL